MKIKQIQAGEIKVPLKTPFKTAVRTVTHMHSLVLRVETDGLDLQYNPDHFAALVKRVETALDMVPLA